MLIAKTLLFLIIIIVTLIDYSNKIIVFLLFQNIKNKMQDFNTFRLGKKKETYFASNKQVLNVTPTVNSFIKKITILIRYIF
jgi:hypothetical protein